MRGRDLARAARMLTGKRAEMSNEWGWGSVLHAVTNHDWRGPSSTAAACCAVLSSLGAFLVHGSGWSAMSGRSVYVWLTIGCAGLCFLVVPRFYKHFQRKEDRFAEMAPDLRSRANQAERLFNKLQAVKDTSRIRTSIMEFGMSLSIFSGKLSDLGLMAPDPSLLVSGSRRAQSFELLLWVTYLKTVADAAEERAYSTELREFCKRSAEMTNPHVAAA